MLLACLGDVLGGGWEDIWGYAWEVCGGVLESFLCNSYKLLGGKHKDNITY